MDFIADDTIDFHEFGELSEYDIELYLIEFLEDSYCRGYEKLLVITGKGKVVRSKVDKLLKENQLVAKYNRAGYYNGQSGAFEVKLVDEMV